MIWNIVFCPEYIGLFWASVFSFQTDISHPSDFSSSTREQPPSSQSEHCCLYFGALQKAIRGFVDSLHNGQPPEKFLPQSKLVIMVGQRLVHTLYKEAHHQGSCQSLLCKSHHLCALLKQLAVATKKAALLFPDKQVLQEVQEFARILAQKAQQFRTSLDVWEQAQQTCTLNMWKNLQGKISHTFIFYLCSYLFIYFDAMIKHDFFSDKA